MAKQLPPINSNQRIVGSDGRPLSAFVLLINQLLGTTFGLTPLSPDPTGIYGDATDIPRITVDEYGRVSSVTEVPVTAGASVEVDSPSGTSIVAAATKLSFSGSGVAVTAGAPGEALIDVSGGGGGGSAPLWLVSAVGTGASQNIALPSAVPNKQSIIVSVNGLRYHTTDYSIAGHTLTVTTNAAGDLIEVVGILAGTTYTPTTSILRASNITTALGSSTLVIPLPAGSVAGDYCVVMWGGHNDWTGVPTGWTTIDHQAGSFFAGAAFGKILTSGDITLGSVTIPFIGSPEDQVGCAATMIGATSGIGTFVSQRDSTGSASVPLTTAAVAVGDLVLCFGSNRDNSTNTVSIGTLLQQNAASTASAVLTDLTATIAGPVTGTFSYSSFASGDYQIILTVKP